MNKVLTVSASAVLAAVMLGCGSSDDGESTTNYLTGEPVVISTPAEAQNAILAASSFGMSGSAGTLSSSRKSPSLAPISDSIECIDGGTISISGDAAETETGSSNMTYMYNNCIEYESTMNGSMSMVGTQYSYTSNMTNFSIVDSEGSMNMNLNQTVSTNSSYDPFTFITSGTMDYAFSTPQNSGQIGYQNFKMMLQDGDTRGSLDGDMSITSSAYSCVDGRYHYETVDLLTFDNNGTVTGGTMKVNDATYVFNSEGTATVTFSDGTTATVQQTAEVVCN